MGTKFQRERTQRRAVYQRLDGPQPRLGKVSQKGRLRLIYIGVGVIAAVLYVGHGLARTLEFYEQPLIEGTGTIVAVQDAGTRAVIEVRTRDGQALRGEAELPPTLHGNVQPNERLAIVFQPNRAFTRIRIVETGIVALAPKAPKAPEARELPEEKSAPPESAPPESAPPKPAQGDPATANPAP